MIFWLGFFIVMWMMFLFGFPHLSWRAACRREVTRQGSSLTSNSAKPFVMEIDKAERITGKWVVTGNARGPKPDPGDVLYLVDGEKRIPVVLRRVKTLSMKEEGKGIILKLVLFGAGSGTISDKAFLTNIREKKNRASQEEEKYIEVHYPVVVRARVSEICGFALLILFSALICLLCVNAYISDPDLRAGAAIGGFSSMLLVIIGGIMLAFYLGFKLTIVSEDQVRLRRYFRTTEYHINNLLSHTYLSSDKKEIWHMQLRDGSGTVLCDITERQKGYEEASEAFRQANARRQKRNLYRYLLEHIFYIPAQFTQNEDSCEENAEPLTMVSGESGKRSVYLFEEEESMKSILREEEYDSVIGTRLVDAVSYMEEDRTDCLLVLLNGRTSLYTMEIDPEKWKEIKNYEEAPDSRVTTEKI